MRNISLTDILKIYNNISTSNSIRTYVISNSRYLNRINKIYKNVFMVIDFLKNNKLL